MDEYCLFCGKQIWGDKQIFYLKVTRLAEYNKKKSEYKHEELEEEFSLCKHCYEGLLDSMRESARLGEEEEDERRKEN